MVELVHVVLGKQVVRVGHGLKLEVVPGGILEKHGPLLPRLPLSEHMAYTHSLVEHAQKVRV